MKNIYLHLVSIPVLTLATCVNLRAQDAAIPPYQTRVALVETVSKIVELRGTSFKIADDVVDPFVGKVKVEAPVVTDYSTVVAPVGLSGPELLSQLAGKIPSTGTFVFGGNSILLLGSKRYMVGDTIVVNQDGKDYQLTLTAVSSTSFTVKMGNDVSTRPVRKR